MSPPGFKILTIPLYFLGAEPAEGQEIWQTSSNLVGIICPWLENLGGGANAHPPDPPALKRGTQTSRSAQPASK